MRSSLKIDWLRFARLQTDGYWSKVVVLGVDECWLWTGGKDKDGYGKFAITAPRALVPTSAPIQKHIRAHRLAWALKHGRLLNTEEYCLHTCDTPAFVNDRHLFTGTALDNAIDCVAKGRSSCGEKGGNARLTVEDVLEIRKAFDAKVPRREIGERFDISIASVSFIGRRISWRSVPDRVIVARAINSNAGKRGKIEELLVTPSER